MLIVIQVRNYCVLFY